MQYYQVGPNETEPEVPEGTLWCVVEYTSHDYDGYGTALCFDGTTLYESNLGHCSCYGPDNNGWGKADHITEYSETMEAKVTELMPC